MSNSVINLRYGNTNTFLIRGTSGNLLVDTDYAGTLPLFFKEIKKHNIRLSDITYVMATHYHPDHVGLVGELAEMGIKLLLIDTQVGYVHFSDKIFARDNLKYVPIDREKANIVSCEESRVFLRDNMGINGEILSTPSHSNDSVSLILDGGICFVGDLEPIDHLNAYEDNQALKKDWELIRSRCPKTVFYAHVNEKFLS